MNDGWWEQFRTALRDQLGPPLKALHAPIDTWLSELPMFVATMAAVGLYLVALVGVWRMRREFVFRGAPDHKWWRDLRIWATVVLLPYIAVYMVLGQ